MKKILFLIGSLIILNNAPSLASNQNEKAKKESHLKAANDGAAAPASAAAAAAAYVAARPAPITIKPKKFIDAYHFPLLFFGTIAIRKISFDKGHVDAKGNVMPELYEPNILHGPSCTNGLDCPTPVGFTSRIYTDGTKTFHKNNN